jgi:hypothetical protein
MRRGLALGDWPSGGEPGAAGLDDRHVRFRTAVAIVAGRHAAAAGYDDDPRALRFLVGDLAAEAVLRWLGILAGLISSK